MPIIRKLNCFALLLSLLFACSLAKADTNSDIETLLNWAESQYPDLFPQQSTTETLDIWRYRFYPQTNLYVGVNNQNEVWVLGDIFGGMQYIGTLADMLTLTGGSSGEGTGTSVSLENFDLFTKTGIWRLKGDFSYAGSQSFDFGSSQIVTNYTADIDMTSVHSIKFNSPTDVVFTECSAVIPEQLSDDDFKEEIVSDTTDDEEEDLYCPSGTSFNYVKVTDDHYKLEYKCNATTQGTIDFKRISNSSLFSQGSLSFSTNLVGGSLSASEVCGSILNVDSVVSTTGGDFGGNETSNIRNIDVAGTYGWGRIQFAFSFFQAPAVGTYSIASSLNGATSNLVTARVVSPVFGGTGQAPEGKLATSGTVTVNSVSEYAANACFDLTTADATTFNGCFNFNLQ